MVAEDSNASSSVVPLLVAVLVCDAAVEDRSTGKKSLIGIFNRINVATFPTKRPMALYIKLTEAEGDYKIQARYVQVRSQRELARVEVGLKATDRAASSDVYVMLPPLPIPSEGQYEFQIWANSIFLGSTAIDVVQRVQRRKEADYDQG
jgi:hypothetical protein